MRKAHTDFHTEEYTNTQKQKLYAHLQLFDLLVRCLLFVHQLIVNDLHWLQDKPEKTNTVDDVTRPILLTLSVTTAKNSHASDALVKPRIIRQRGDLGVRELGMFMYTVQLINLQVG